MKAQSFIILLTSIALLLSQNNLQAQEIIDPDVGDVYPLETCILSGEILEDDPEIFDLEGQEIRVCCDDCKTKFTEESYIRVDELNALIKEKQLPFYPLKKCLVTGKNLGTDAVNFVFRNRLFRLSSDEAKAKIKSAPGKYFGDLDQAVIEKQLSNYPLKVCVVSGEKLADESIDHVIANQLVRLAAFDQLSEFNENPGKYLAKIQEAR
jgi:hypothetical protein